MYGSLAEACRPIWSPGLFELNTKSLHPSALEVAVLNMRASARAYVAFQKQGQDSVRAVKH